MLATVSDKRLQVSAAGSTVDSYTADVVSAQDYYPFGMLMPGRSYNVSGYCYGFNGKENDNEVKGEGNQQDYGMRIYDLRIGRFLSVDPLTRSYPFLTPYAFAENDVISSIDLDGLEKYRIVGRSFAPRGAFEGTHFESKADDRTKFSPADYRQVSARIHTQVTFDWKDRSVNSIIYSQPTIDKAFKGKWKISNQRVEANAFDIGRKEDNTIGLIEYYYAKNGLEVGPGIDMGIGLVMSLKNNKLFVDAEIRGNVFPAQETILFDGKGVGVFLGVSTAKGSPFTGVWGTGFENLLSRTKTTIQVNDNGDFLGIVDKVNGKEVVRSVDSWNSKYSEQDVWDKQKGREDYKKE